MIFTNPNISVARQLLMLATQLDSRQLSNEHSLDERSKVLTQIGEYAKSLCVNILPHLFKSYSSIKLGVGKEWSYHWEGQ